MRIGIGLLIGCLAVAPLRAQVDAPAGHTVTVHMSYNGKPVVPTTVPDMYVQNTSTGAFFNTQMVWNHDDTVTISDLPAGHYVVEIASRETALQKYLPGGLFGQSFFAVADRNIDITAVLSRLIHVVQPIDNAAIDPVDANACAPHVASSAQLAWEPIDVPNATYTYTIFKVPCHGEPAQIAKGTTSSTSVPLFLPGFEGAYYAISIDATSPSGEKLGVAMTLGRNWWKWSVAFLMPGGVPPIVTGQTEDQADAPADYDMGVNFELGRTVPLNVVDAVKWYRKAAENGYAIAASRLGEIYASGDGVPKDSAEAVKWLLIAAQAGQADAATWLGSIYMSGDGVPKDEQQGAAWYAKAAQQGDPYAANMLSTFYENGQGVSKDPGEAIRWLTFAAERGYSDAQWSLGRHFANGVLVPKNPELGLTWYRKAAEQDHFYAAVDLGEMYRDGTGIKKDSAEALKWFTRAAEEGYAPAQVDAGLQFERGDGVPQDYKTAAGWYMNAAAQNNADAIYYLATAYDLGRGVPHDVSKAVELFAQLADDRDGDSLFQMGRHYASGDGLPKDATEAAQCYRGAADAGIAEAQAALGRAYENGRGVPQDVKLAISWLQKAFDAYDFDAAADLNRIFSRFPAFAAMVHLRYDSKPLVPSESPQVSLYSRDRRSLIDTKQMIWNHDDTVTIPGLTNGHYSMTVRSCGHALRDASPGAFTTNVEFDIAAADQDVVANEQRLIHIIAPVDNAAPPRNAHGACSTQVLAAEPAQLAWEPLDVPHAIYTYKVTKMRCGGGFTIITSGETMSTSVPLQLEHLSDGEYYIVRVQAHSPAGIPVGDSMSEFKSFDVYGIRFALPATGTAPPAAAPAS